MKTTAVLVAWLLLTAAAAHFVPNRQQPQTIAYTHSPDDLQRPFPTNDTTPGEAKRFLQTVQLNTLSTARPVARSAPTTTTATVPRPARVYPAPTGTCAEWVAAAGIVDTASAFELIRLESGCDPYIKNRYSGACGVAQELPCGKSGCALGDGACQVAWMADYVAQRYGSFANAVAFRLSRGWY